MKQHFPSALNSRRQILYDTGITIIILVIATLCSFLFFQYGPENHMNISLVFMLAVMLIARYTSSYVPGVAASVIGVVCINFCFTYPYFELNFTLSGYPVIFFCMLTISLITSTTTTHMKQQGRMLNEREKLLMEAEKEKMRANLLRAVSHDLRTPLTSIIGASTSWLENEMSLDASEKRELIQHVYDDSTWLLHMVENLLSVTRIQSDSAKVSKSLEVVEEVVGEAVTRLKKRLPEARITVNTPDEFLMIPMDAMLIEQVLINLLENAVIHARSEQPIECRVISDDNYIYFHIIDYGIGIPADKLATIFAGSVYSGSDTVDSRKGMGIGLSICKTIISAHNGEIAAKNHERGAEFYFNLPREEMK